MAAYVHERSRVPVARQDTGQLSRSSFVGACGYADQEMLLGLADVSPVDGSGGFDLLKFPPEPRSAAATALTSPARVGAPGRVAIATREATTAVSSTKVPSG